MHHSLRFYGGHRPGVLRFYMFGAKCTRIPLVGRLVRRIANAYGSNMHRVYLLTPAEAEKLLDIAEGVAVGPCDCRKAFGNCDNPIDVEILLGPTRHILLETMRHDSHEINREKAKEMPAAKGKRVITSCWLGGAADSTGHVDILLAPDDVMTALKR